MIEKNEKTYIVSIEENVEETLKAIGQTIIDRATDIARDIEDVGSISIYASIRPNEVTTVDISKSYFAKN